MFRYKDLDTEVKDKYMKMFNELSSIVEDDRFDWDRKFEFCFDSGLHSEMQGLYEVDYYDPDTSSKEDVMAFYLAAKNMCEDMRWFE